MWVGFTTHRALLRRLYSLLKHLLMMRWLLNSAMMHDCSSFLLAIVAGVMPRVQQSGAQQKGDSITNTIIVIIESRKNICWPIADVLCGPSRSCLHTLPVGSLYIIMTLFVSNRSASSSRKCGLTLFILNVVLRICDKLGQAMLT